jgi:hypothetical protein
LSCLKRRRAGPRIVIPVARHDQDLC